MRLVHLIVSIPMVLMLAFWGGLPSAIAYVSLFGLASKKINSGNFDLLFYTIPLLLIFLIIYNVELIGKHRPTWSRVGLITSEIVAIVALLLGIYFEWGNSSIVGGFNQGIATFFIIPFVIQLLTTLIQTFNDEQYQTTVRRQ